MARRRRYRIGTRSYLKRAKQQVRILANPGRVAHLLGLLHQQRVGNALGQLENAEIVSQVLETATNGEEDKAGIDFLVTAANGWVTPLQVKSSNHHARLFRIRHPSIPVIISNGRMAQEEIIKQVQKIIAAP